jgi:hypothetical protein
MKLTGNRNQCQSCKEYFNSNTAFDKHRTGEHGFKRRCRTPEEMIALGMSKNNAGFWITEKYDGPIRQGESDDESEQPELD